MQVGRLNVTWTHPFHVRAQTPWLIPFNDVMNGEALGLICAIKWVRMCGFRNLIFELDAKLVVDAFNSSNSLLTDVGCIQDCKELFYVFSSNSHVEFSRRNVNKMAHAPTRVALSNGSLHSYFEVPSNILPILLNEMN